jgi:hypothetical protein
VARDDGIDGEGGELPLPLLLLRRWLCTNVAAASCKDRKNSSHLYAIFQDSSHCINIITETMPTWLMKYLIISCLSPFYWCKFLNCW